MKDDEFFLGVLDNSENTTEHERPKIRQVYHITSGDPSRGSLALESEAAPSPGTTVQVGRSISCTECTLTAPQIYRSPANANPNTLSRYKLSSSENTKLRRMAFTVAPPDLVSNAYTDNAETVVLEDTFLAASENGFLIDRCVPDGKSDECPWTCKVPGGVAELRWSSG